LSRKTRPSRQRSVSQPNIGLNGSNKRGVRYENVVLKIVNTRAAKSEDFPASIDLAARGVLKLKPLVTHVLSLSQLESAIGMLESDADCRMKIILENN